MPENTVVFDRAYSADKIGEGRAIQWAVMSGECEKCKNLYECEHNRRFKFPKRAACMKKKAELLKKGANHNA